MGGDALYLQAVTACNSLEPAQVSRLSHFTYPWMLLQGNLTVSLPFDLVNLGLGAAQLFLYCVFLLLEQRVGSM